MIALFLKHKILEYSIDRLFKTIEGNFKTLPDISIGNTFRSISMAVGSHSDGFPIYKSYTDCTITSVYSGMYLNKPATLFNFTDDTGDLILGCTSNDIVFSR